MKKKQIMTSFVVFTFAALLLAGCSADNNGSNSSSSSTSATEMSSSTAESSKEATKVAGADLQDGTYRLEEKNYSNNYRVVFEMVVKDGKITESDYDYIDADGKSKKDDEDYNANMAEKTGVGPSEYIPQLNEELVKTQMPTEVEVVTGATHSSDAFINYAQQLIQAAQAGDTETIEIDNGAALKDGTYTLKEKNNSNGYHTVFSITVADGKVTESDYDNVNDEGQSKKDDEEYNTNMKDKSGTNPEEYIVKYNEEFVDVMDEEDGVPGDIDVVSGATHSYHSFVMYAEQLINAAEKGDTKEIVVDNIVTE